MFRSVTAKSSSEWNLWLKYISQNISPIPFFIAPGKWKQLWGLQRMQPRMNSSKAHLLHQIRAVKGNRLGYPRHPNAPPPPLRLPMNAAIFRPMTHRDNIQVLLGLFGPLAVHRDISSVLLGAVAVVLITGSHTIQQRNVNLELCFIWTCRKTIKSFCFKFFTWLLWNRVSTAEKYTFLPI